ncbi:MAG: patatin-like phospholipase family protein [Rubrivivax sp.]|nr:patatin-like phospholipase family protein [Rubrivivax sp.]
MTPDTPRPHHLDTLLMQHLHAALPDLEPAALDLLRSHLEWVEIAGGQPLMTQGEPGDAMYLLVSGRLRASIRQHDGSQRVVREIARGQVVGEMSLYTDEPRSATLVAIRDSVLVRLGKSAFTRLLTLSAQASIALTRQIIQRLQTEGQQSLLDRPVTMGLIPISEGVDHAQLAQRLAAQLATHGRVAVVDAATLDSQLGEPGITARPDSDTDANRRIALHLDEIEAAHDFVLLISDASSTPWTQRCTRHSDELLLLANADAQPALHPIEVQCLVLRPPRTDATEVLVLLHPAERQSPQHTAAWLERRPVADHLHIRPTLDRDIARLARLQSRNGVGLVLAGGGARGLAHLGVHRALRERGIDVDVAGGTSIGSVMAAIVASDADTARVMEVTRWAFGRKPTSDFSWLPLVSLIKGRRLRTVVRDAMLRLIGHEADMEDLWKGCYCVASNYSRASEVLLRRGPLLRAVLASAAIPGALPPVVVDGDLLCDGGTFNNFPVDVMRRWRGVGRVIGVDLSGREPRKLDFDTVPGTAALLRDKLRPKAQRRYRLPSLVSYLINVTVLYSTSRQREARAQTQLYFNPALTRVGMLDWHRFDHIVQQGYEHGLAVLDEQQHGLPVLDEQQHGRAVPGGQ